MDRELLLEIGCEELPASWLPGLTNQIGEIVAAQLREHRLPPESPVETYSTPRRLTVRIVRIPERQTDLEELVNGPPVSASFKPDGTPTPAAAGFAAKQGVEVGALERAADAEGRVPRVPQAPARQGHGRRAARRARAARCAACRFPKSMHWDAMLEDGRGELLFGRPIRWMLFIYGGRVVPFTIARTPAAQTAQVQDVSTGAVTYGHRFLTTSGRAGRAIKVRSFDEYRARLLENFVILERSERHNKIARELDAKAQRLQGRVSRDRHARDRAAARSAGSGRVPVGRRRHVRARVPRAARRSADDDADSSSALLSGRGRGRQAEERVPRGHQHRARQRAHDRAQRRARRHGAAARRALLLGSRSQGSARVADRSARHAAVPQEARHLQGEGRAHRAAGRVDRRARRSAPTPRRRRRPRTAARLAKADLTTDMVREFTELQGTMGGIYARDEGQPEEVWKAIYFHYLPVGVEADAPPTRAQLGKAAVTWAAVSLADKLDTIVGLFAAGEKPTGSRDPYGLRRAAQGVVKILDGSSDLTGVRRGDRSIRGVSTAFAASARQPNEDWRRSRCSSSSRSARRTCSSGAASRRTKREPSAAHLGHAGVGAEAGRSAGAGAQVERTSRRWRSLFKRRQEHHEGLRRHVHGGD